MQTPSRTVKVAQISKSEIWSTISPSVFANYWFQLDDEVAKFFEQASAKIALEFIDFSQDLYGISDYGYDPYARPFLNFYVVEVRAGKELAESQKDDIIKWTENAAMTQTTHLILILKEEEKWINKVLDITQVVSDVSNILVIPFRGGTSPKLRDESIAQIKEATRARITADFEAYITGAEQRIAQLSSAKVWEQWRLKVWRGLLLYSFGFTKRAYSALLECYDGIVNDWKEPLKEMLARKLDEQSITNHPFTLSEEPADVLLFDVQGMMAIMYTNNDMDGVVNLFFQYFALLRKMCRTTEEFAEVDHWGEEGIRMLLPLTKNDNGVCSRLYLRLFSLVDERNGDLAPVYQNLMSCLESQRMKGVVQAQYLIWEAKHNKVTPVELSDSFGWSFGAEAAAILFSNALAQDPVDRATAKKYGRHLLADGTPYNDKRSILDKLASIEGPILQIKAPCRLNMYYLESCAFSRVVPAGSPFDVTIKLRVPKWMPDVYDDIVLVMSLGADKPVTRRQSAKGSISGEIVFHVHLDKPGQWRIVGLGLGYKNVRLVWLIQKTQTIVVSEQQEIPIQVTFPRIITPMKQMTADVTLNLTDISTQQLELSARFASDAAELPPQEGSAKFITGTSSAEVAFTLADDGKLTFAEDPCMHIVSFQWNFTVKDPNVETVSLLISSTIDSQQFEHVAVLRNTQPLACEGRLMGKAMMHLCLLNTCDVPLYISNDTIKEREILPNQKTYVLQKLAAGEFSLTVHEKDGESITKTWQLNDSLLAKRVNAELDKHGPIPVGSVVGVKVTLPECSSYTIQGTPETIISGQTSVSNFKGGEVRFQVIPLTGGILEMPTITVDGKAQTIHPQFLDVVCSPLLSYGPFI